MPRKSSKRSTRPIRSSTTTRSGPPMTASATPPPDRAAAAADSATSGPVDLATWAVFLRKSLAALAGQAPAGDAATVPAGARICGPTCASASRRPLSAASGSWTSPAWRCATAAGAKARSRAPAPSAATPVAEPGKSSAASKARFSAPWSPRPPARPATAPARPSPAPAASAMGPSGCGSTARSTSTSPPGWTTAPASA